MCCFRRRSDVAIGGTEVADMGLGLDGWIDICATGL